MFLPDKKTMRLFAALCLFFAVPFIYTCVRTALLAAQPDTSGLGVAGHIEWFDLINETILAFLTVPFYSLLNREADGLRFQRKLWDGFYLSFGIYAAFSIIIAVFAGNIAAGTGVAQEQLASVTVYLILETIAFVCGYAASFAAIVFAVIGKPVYILGITVIRTVLTIVSDVFLIPVMGANGVAVSNIIVNLAAAAVCFVFLLHEKLGPVTDYKISKRPDFYWLREYARTGLFSGGQILLDNLIYALIVCKMVNEVAEQGNYWTANNFIWGLLLVPSMAVSELIRRDAKADNKIVQYMTAAACTAGIWILSMPLWRPFLRYAMGLADPEPILNIIITLMPFYVCYLISQVFANVFIALGMTGRNFIVSVAINIGYYGAVYGAYLNGAFEPGIEFICMMFGFGMMANLLVTGALYFQYNLKKYHEFMRFAQP